MCVSYATTRRFHHFFSAVSQQTTTSQFSIDHSMEPNLATCFCGRGIVAHLYDGGTGVCPLRHTCVPCCSCYAVNVPGKKLRGGFKTVAEMDSMTCPTCKMANRRFRASIKQAPGFFRGDSVACAICNTPRQYHAGMLHEYVDE